MSAIVTETRDHGLFFNSQVPKVETIVGICGIDVLNYVEERFDAAIKELSEPMGWWYIAKDKIFKYLGRARFWVCP
ncbi:hypothetical protein HanXRQr2_Chr15g0678381 [Helianthus annuus]|uniref:Uncharacterized protein n=1 Tax=Helianthus annuus TaxID=4232 RepID=A0A251S621_HELAN|nr:hypothetical protein HanXRQr2_Chr15g0678381 [Helianthus annuus]KAJ0830016.1 hypothetical protein HanPSC8_Chr15g0650391 [Helianthus annuus]